MRWWNPQFRSCWPIQKEKTIWRSQSFKITPVYNMYTCQHYPHCTSPSWNNQITVKARCSSHHPPAVYLRQRAKRRLIENSCPASGTSPTSSNAWKGMAQLPLHIQNNACRLDAPCTTKRKLTSSRRHNLDRLRRQARRTGPFSVSKNACVD